MKNNIKKNIKKNYIYSLLLMLNGISMAGDQNVTTNFNRCIETTENRFIKSKRF